MLAQIKEAVAAAWDILFSTGTITGSGDTATTTGKGVVVLFLGFLQANPILLLPFGFYLLFLGIRTARKLVTGN